MWFRAPICVFFSRPPLNTYATCAEIQIVSPFKFYPVVTGVWGHLWLTASKFEIFRDFQPLLRVSPWSPAGNDIERSSVPLA